MKRLAFSIRDAAADVYSPPFFVATEGVAIRSFTDVVNDNSTEIYNHPEHFALYSVGSFDDNCGEFSSCKPSLVCSADSLKKSNVVKLPVKEVGNA